MRGLAVVTALLVSGVLLVPSGLAQDTIDNPEVSTPTTLYFHIFDTFNKFVINTQPMDSEFFEVGGANFFTLRDTPVNQAYPILTNQNPSADPVDWDFNTIYGISTAGPVEYDFDENGQPRFHPEPGIAKQVEIDGTVTPVVTLYATLRDVIGGPDFANGMVDYTYRITVREGDDPGRETETLDTGKLIMSGKQTFHVFDTRNCDETWLESGECAQVGAQVNTGLSEQGTGPDGNPIVVPDEDGILEFKIPLTIAQEFIPKKEAFNVRIDGYQGTGTGQFEEDQFSEGYLRYHADPDHLPRLDFNVKNPIYIEFVHPQVAAGTLLIHTGVNSPWGTYDVNLTSIDVELTGPRDVPETSLRRIVTANTHVHGLHDQAAEITYLWKFRDENAPEGDYEIQFSVSNNGQVDADGNVVPESRRTATATAGFVIKGEEAYGIDTEQNVVPSSGVDGEKDTPALGVVPALALLAAALILRRRTA